MQWGEAQERAFVRLQGLLLKDPILRLPNVNAPFTLQTDASDTGVGAALLQEHPDGLFPVMYASKKLLPREQKYSVIERECLAIVFAYKKIRSVSVREGVHGANRPSAPVLHKEGEDREQPNTAMGPLPAELPIQN